MIQKTPEKWFFFFQSIKILCALCASAIMSSSVLGQDALRFEDVTDAVGLGSEVVGTTIARCSFADLNSDNWPDAIINRKQIFLNVADETSPIGRKFVEVEATGLPEMYRSDLIVFADLDNDGNLDAIITRYIDKNNEKWEDHGLRTAWYVGNGDGTFSKEWKIDVATPATTCAIAIRPNLRLEIILGNWYTEYGENLEAYRTEILTQPDWGLHQIWEKYLLPWNERTHPDAVDPLGRPTYGIMVARITDHSSMFNPTPLIIELNYGRRWNRLFEDQGGNVGRQDIAPDVGFDGDSIRHGKHPEWLKERAKTDPRFDREDEKPFRANGNTFDCAVGDIDNDGDWDIFISEITHGWAGESSDRSRFLINNGKKHEEFSFEYDPRLSVDRIPEGVNNWNQGDLFCELADFNHDTRLDLLLSSGDYPDNQRLRLYLQQEDGTFKDSTTEVGLDHDGSQQVSLADVNGDGALDILVGQTFNRFTKEMREGREPQLRLFISKPAKVNNSMVLHLAGDPTAGSNRDGLGTIVTAKVGNVQMQRQLIGIGGHAGKQHDFIIHFGLGNNKTVDELIVIWPNGKQTKQKFENVTSGSYTLQQGGKLQSLK